MEITNIIYRLLDIYADQYDLDAYHINCGDCENFAIDIINVLGDEAELFWPSDMLDFTEAEGDEFPHCFIRYHKRFYDSQAPDGVDHWRQLPCFKCQTTV